MRNQRLAVLITSYNRVKKTLNCLESLFNSMVPAGLEISVYLVDDKSPDNTGTVIKEKFPEVNIIEGTGDLFWTRGMHLAWQSALEKKEYDFLLWLNDDIKLFPDSVNNIIETSFEINNQSIIVGSTCSENNKSFTYGGIKLPNHKVIPNGKPQLCDTFNGNFVLIPKYVYKKVGVIDKLFHHAIGDLDYGLRAKKAGIKSYVAKKYIGTCERHEQLPSWCLPETPFLKRVKSLYSPLGCSQPYYFFRYELRHFGLVKAAFHFFTIHLRLTFPSLWN